MNLKYQFSTDPSAPSYNDNCSDKTNENNQVKNLTLLCFLSSISPTQKRNIFSVIAGISILSLSLPLYSQTSDSSIPKDIKRSAKYIFYLHGGVVTNLGNNAINPPVPHYGPYEYLNILDTLKKKGFYVISERRFPKIDDSVYANKIVKQIDSLLNKGAKSKNITVLGASAGWNICMLVSASLKNKKLRYIIMGGCWPNDYKDYQTLDLHGHFLSIIEATDPHGTCSAIFENRIHITSYKEIKLNTGLEHGFIYKGYKEWVNPVVEWCKLK